MEKLNKLDQLLLFILDRAEKRKIENLSDFQFMKILYLIEFFALKFAGTKFVNEVFTRGKNGPITISFYGSREKLLQGGFIKTESVPNLKYGYPRNANSIGKKRLNKFNFTIGETIFLDNFLSDLLSKSQRELKKMAYNTEPMKAILIEEKNGSKEGAIMDFDKIIIDPDVIETYPDELV